MAICNGIEIVIIFKQNRTGVQNNKVEVFRVICAILKSLSRENICVVGLERPEEIFSLVQC